MGIIRHACRPFPWHCGGIIGLTSTTAVRNMTPTTRFVSIAPQSRAQVEVACLLVCPVQLDAHSYTFALHAASPTPDAEMAISLYETGQRLGYLRDASGRNMTLDAAQHIAPEELSSMLHSTITRLYSRIGPGLTRVLNQSLADETWVNRGRPALTTPNTHVLATGGVSA